MATISMISRSCPICGPEEDPSLFAEANVDLDSLDGFAFASRKLPEYMHWRLLECRRCNLLYANPAPPISELARLYRDAEFESSREARYASRTYGRYLSSICPELPDLVGAVDVGTGDGVFLHELVAAGFSRVVGVEPSDAPIATADPVVKPLIRHDIFRSDSFPPDSLSLVTCFQTIEHLPDPFTFCQDAFRVLKPGGALFLIGHNRRAVSARLLGKRSPIFDIEHMQLFSASSLHRMLKSAGFQRVRIRPLLNRYPLRYWAQLFPFPAPIKRRLLRSLEGSALGRLVVPLPAGNLAAVAFKARA